MPDVDRELEDGLRRIALGETSPEEYLGTLPPAHRTEIRRLLTAALQLQASAKDSIDPEIAPRIRTRVLAHAKARPRRLASASIPPRLGNLRPATGLALALALFLTGTAAAQAALPGDLLYGWKRTTEMAARSVAWDPGRIDMEIAQRRADELVRVAGDARAGAARLALEESLKAVLESDNPVLQAEARRVLADERAEIEAMGASDAAIDSLFRDLGLDVPEAGSAPAPGTATPGILGTILPPLPTLLP